MGRSVGGRAVVAQALREPGRLRAYVAGLKAIGALSDDAYVVAQEQLDVLGH
ncbi:hypothetical protein [Streptomyces sp. NPDC059003]|uniref:hypothetical protein n=1 Tax=Streptomyces sp. NPDC059003 TaxID=3346691 RepID=UPI0036B63B1C